MPMMGTSASELRFGPAQRSSDVVPHWRHLAQQPAVDRGAAFSLAVSSTLRAIADLSAALSDTPSALAMAAAL